MKNSLMWFRYDLRIKDNEAFFAASENELCLPIFILDEGFLKLNTTSDFHLSFLNDSLMNLNENLKERFNATVNQIAGLQEDAHDLQLAIAKREMDLKNSVKVVEEEDLKEEVVQ